MENETTDKTVILAGLDAAGLVDEVGPHSAETEGWQVSMVDERTVLAVGFAGVKKGRRIASGRVAWLRRDPDMGWVATSASTDHLNAYSKMAGVDTFDDLVALLAWLRGGEPLTR